MADGLTPESWSRLERLFEQALARPDGARAEFLAGACGDDLVLRREVEALLDAHASTEGPLERLVVELGSPLPGDRGVLPPRIFERVCRREHILPAANGHNG